MIRHGLFSAAVLGLLCVSPPQYGAFAEGTTRASAQTQPAVFLQKAAVSDLFEVQSSKLALERATTQEAKAFAQLMMKDHTASTEKLKTAAAKDGIAVPSAPELDDAHAAKLRRLQDASADDFDKVYLTQQKLGHEEALHLHRGYAREGEGAALKSAAAEIAQVVERHLGHLKAMGKRS